MLEVLIHVLIHSIKDNLNLIPFLFIAFLIIELIEHKFSNESKKIIKKSGKFGPIIGAILGVIPQCGFSVIGTNFYITRVISIGTLISIYLSTSDEMLPIMIGKGVDSGIILYIIIIKVLSGMIFGFIIDLIIRKKDAGREYDYHLCEEDECDCEHGIVISSLKHTFNTLLFIICASFLINLLYELVGEAIISKILMKDNLFGPFIGSIIGLIPSCAASVVLTELYLNSAINLGTCIAGLLTSSGVAILVLIKSNKNFKENISIVSLLYLIGVLIGIFIEFMDIIL